jgi:hypothetical protein
VQSNLGATAHTITLLEQLLCDESRNRQRSAA